MNIRTGFTAFEKTGQFTPNFIDDVNVMIAKIYRQWSLYEDIDEFNASCWCKLVSSLKIFDSSVGSLSTYIFQVIWNEATRIHSKHKNMSHEDITEQSHSESMWVQNKSDDSDLLHRDRVCSFARKAFDMGVFVNQRELYKNYILGNLSPAVKTFMWHSYFLGRSA